MRINVMKKGDSILNVTDNMVVVKRRNGEVDVIPFYKSGKVWRVDQENTVTIGYGNNTVEEVVAEGNVTEYSRAAEPPVQCGVSHLSRRTEPHCL